MTTETTTPRVWIGCLAAYNAGHLHGEWVDAAVSDGEIWAAQQRVLASSPIPGAEEHFIADNEGFGPWHCGEYENLSVVAKVARLIDEHGVAFAAWLANDSYTADGNDEDDLEEAFREEYRGEWDSEEDFARYEVGELGLPYVGSVYAQKGGYGYQQEYESWTETLDRLDTYLDWATITRDLMQDCWSHEQDGKVHVFRSS